MNISILGCGWLGLPLAKELITGGHIIKGSTTSNEKISALSSEGIIPYQIKLFEEGIQGDISSFLKDTEVLIIDIPPGLRKNPTENFIAKMGRLMEQIEVSPVQHLIFIGSTSVFEDREDMPLYTEDDEPNSTQTISKQLIAVEKLISSKNVKTSIVRFGGLFGPGRHPVNYLAGRKDIKDPGAPVNLIHQDNCIELIKAIVELGLVGVFHGIHPEHPLKAEYYRAIAAQKNLALPEFNHSLPSKGKIIRSIRVKEEIGMEFRTSLL